MHHAGWNRCFKHVSGLACPVTCHRDYRPGSPWPDTGGAATQSRRWAAWPAHTGPVPPTPHLAYMAQASRQGDERVAHEVLVGVIFISELQDKRHLVSGVMAT